MNTILELMQARSNGAKNLTISKVALIAFLGMNAVGLQAQSLPSQPKNELDYSDAQLVTKTAGGWQVKTLDAIYAMRDDPREKVAKAMPKDYNSLSAEKKLVALDNMSWLPLNRIRDIKVSRGVECVAFITPLGIITGEKGAKSQALDGLASMRMAQGKGHDL